MRGWILAAGASLAAVVYGVGAATSDDAEKTGGATTVYADGRNAFSFPAANLSDEERTRFAIGNSFFRRNWVEAPASTTARDGLGPHFIARSCGGCHVQDGRGAPPSFRKGLHDQPVGLLMRLSVPGTDAHGGPAPEPVYGGQFNNAAVQGVRPEGQVLLRYETVAGRFKDGSRYSLLKPYYSFGQLGYGAMAPDVMVGPRIAPQLIGVGLLEAIPEAEILRNAAEQAATPGPIKGQVNRVWDAFAEKPMIGRFGWKANVATIAHQSAGAFLGDMGITSPQFPQEDCMPAQADCRAAPSGAKGASPEIDAKTLADVVFYQATLAPPARRRIDDLQVKKGQVLFQQAQCAACHRPSYTTAEGPFPSLSSKALNGQKIWPYTDLLLHDMGEGLADGRPDFQASGRQWKTPPLWGVGLIKDVNGHSRLLHDGRARGVLEAVLWHGGEAEAAKQQVLGMTRAERAALVKFVESL
ncbi:di-heme oxidoreductase family protein [Paucibacter sp. M5-1]|uniref:di-heme oxidoreductase family protein n=1 Tax=Paucibacter sp. M5-1 TaxID=3015998 RepID=UPI0022B9074F|nr:di-heme oxidoredictase family protein [Paucibacter sp. M5-1]MCZ7883446.1 c-type cytochrome [Paucibacter sp. M5-1]